MNMTLSQLRQLNASNAGHFFDRDTLKAFGETMKSYKIVRQNDSVIEVQRVADSKVFRFSKATGRIL